MLQIKIADRFGEWKNTFLISSIICLLGVCVSISNFSLSIDGWGLVLKDKSFIQEGRWVYHIFYNVLCSKTLIPVISPILSIPMMVLAGIGLCRFWSVKSDISRILTICIFVIHPYMIDMYNFTEAQLPYSFGYAIAALALNLNKRKQFLLSIILISISLATYQLVLCFMLSAIAIMIIRRTMSSDTLKMIFNDVVGHIIAITAAMILYYAFYKFLLLSFNIAPGVRAEQGLISSWNDLIMKLGVTAIISAVRFLPVSEFVISGFAKTLSVVVLLLGFAAAIKFNIGKNRNLCKICVILGVFLLMPLLAFSILIPLKSHAMPFRISVGVIVFIAGAFAISSDSDNDLLKTIVRVIGIVLVVNFIFNNNVLFFKQYVQNQRDIALANRIAYRIESLADYEPGMKLAIYGNMAPDAYKMQGDYRRIFVEYFNHCRTREYSVSRGAFEADFSKYAILTNYLALPLKAIFDDTQDRHFEKLVYDRGVWPSKDSVFVEGDTIIVIIDK